MAHEPIVTPGPQRGIIGILEFQRRLGAEAVGEDPDAAVELGPALAGDDGGRRVEAVAGAVAVNVQISHWLFVCTVLLALFIALAKRRHELVLLADDATSHRRILSEYSPYLLDQMISVVTASTLLAYIFYTISPETEARFGTSWLWLTIPFPLYGIFRYLYLVHRREGGGNPADLLISDRPLLVCVALWGAAVTLVIYRPF